MNRWLWTAALVLLGPGLALAQVGPRNPAVVGNPSYTGYGAPPSTYIPGAFGNPSYSGYNAPRYGVGFNPSYTGYNFPGPSSVGSGLYDYNSVYNGYQSPYSIYRYNGEGRDAYSPQATQSSYYAPRSIVGPEAGPVESPPAAAERYPQAVTLEVRVPTPATEVWVEGGRTTSVGTDRTFVSPKLEPGTRYLYEVRARWVQDGKDVDRTRKVPVYAGQRVPVDFTKPEK